MDHHPAVVVPITTTITTTTASVPPFLVDERVLCHQENGDTYEGVVRNAKYDPRVGDWSFFIHYNGWNSRHDKWVAANQILKQQQQQQIINRKRTLNNEDEPRQQADNDDDDDTNVENENDRQQQQQSRPRKRVARGRGQMELVLPFTLKTVLMEEMECITVRKWLHRLPAAVPIRKLLNHFVKKKNSNKNNNSQGSSSEAFCQKLVEIFQHALPKCLLYEQERAQFEAMQKADQQQQQEWVDVYGCEFLLRLAVQLPEQHLLYLSNHNNNGTAASLFQELLVLLQKNKVGLFPTTLVSAQTPNANYCDDKME